MLKNKRTLVLGASPNPERYAFLAVQSLHNHGYEVVPVGIREGSIASIPIDTHSKVHQDIHTLSLYLNPEHQKEWYSYILSTQPRRIIFNPGTENMELETLAQNHGIQSLHACTLVLLNTGQY